MGKRRKGQGGSNSAGGSGGSSILDRNIVSRVENYALNHDLSDRDALVEQMRSCYKEYSRYKLGVFRQMVERAAQRVEERGTLKPELQLQALEQRHLAGRGTRDPAGARKAGHGGTPSASGGSSDSDGDVSGDDDDSVRSDGAGDSSSEPELDEEQALLMASGGVGGMNSALTSMYARSGGGGAGAADVAGAPGTAAGDVVQDGGFESSSGGGGVKKSAAATTGPPLSAPFAPPAVVAAAAARALAQERAAERASRQAAGTTGRLQPGATSPARRDLDGTSPSTSGRVLPDAPPARRLPATPTTTDTQRGAPQAPTGSTPMPAPGGGDKRTAQQAGLNKGRSTVKKARPNAGVGGQSKGSNVSVAKAITYADLGGIEDVLSDIREVIEYPLKHPEVYAWLGVEPPRGVLLHGPPGCGKTALANAIANECGVPFLRVSAPEIVSGMSGESEAKLRSLFQEALDMAPCIIFIDEIDAIFPKRETAQREMERRIVAQMLTCMDDLSSPITGKDEATDGQAGKEDDVAPVEPRGHVVVIGATNRPDALDAALRRAGRFDREIALSIPTEAGRAKILQVLSRRLRLAGDFDFKAVARRTPGFVGADLTALIKEAAAIAVTRIFDELESAHAASQALTAAAQHAAAATAGEPMDVDVCASLASAAAMAVANELAATLPDAPQGTTTAVTVTAITKRTLTTTVAVAAAGPGRRFGGGALTAAELEGLSITMADFECALPKVQPSVRREGFTTTPDVTWEDVGSLDEVRDELTFSITQPIMHPQRFAAMGLSAAAGVLLYGPPGCGKTLVAKAAANESGANFISIKGPELLNKYVGESERAVRQLFQRARAAHPCVLFFDEMDALAPRRGSGDTNQAAERVVNQLLTEMDGVEGRQGVFIVAATNRPDIIDPALLRPGRLDKVLYVPLPPPDGRAAIARALTRRTPLAEGTDVTALAASARCAGFSGADLAALVREACVLALKESMAQPGGHVDSAAPPLVHLSHFERALQRVAPSVSRKDQRSYDALRLGLRATRVRLQAPEPAAALAANDTAPDMPDIIDVAAATDAPSEGAAALVNPSDAAAPVVPFGTAPEGAPSNGPLDTPWRDGDKSGGGAGPGEV